MQWLEVRIKTTSAGMEQTAAYLTALGYDSFIMDDVQEFHEFLERRPNQKADFRRRLSFCLRRLLRLRRHRNFTISS